MGKQNVRVLQDSESEKKLATQGSDPVAQQAPAIGMQDMATLMATAMASALTPVIQEIRHLTPAPQQNGATDMTRLLQEINKGNPESNKARSYKMPVSFDQIDRDDILDKPAIFFCYSSNFFLIDDSRNGQVIQSPYNCVIKFHTILSRIDNLANGEQKRVTVCQARVFSKKEAEWLRNHTVFGSRFHEDQDSAERISPEFALKLTSAQQMISNYGYNQVIDACKALGIPVSQDVSSMRSELIMRYANDLVTEELRFKAELSKGMFNDFEQRKLQKG